MGVNSDHLKNTFSKNLVFLNLDFSKILPENILDLVSYVNLHNPVTAAFLCLLVFYVVYVTLVLFKLRFCHEISLDC